MRAPCPSRCWATTADLASRPSGVGLAFVWRGPIATMGQRMIPNGCAPWHACRAAFVLLLNRARARPSVQGRRVRFGVRRRWRDAPGRAGKPHARGHECTRERSSMRPITSHRQDRLPPAVRQDRLPPAVRQDRLPPAVRQDRLPPAVRYGRLPAAVRYGRLRCGMAACRLPPAARQDDLVETQLARGRAPPQANLAARRCLGGPARLIYWFGPAARGPIHWRGVRHPSTCSAQGHALCGECSRGYSSVGRALAWHARGPGFESP